MQTKIKNVDFFKTGKKDFVSYQSNTVCGLWGLDLHKHTPENKEGAEASSVVEHWLSRREALEKALKKRRGWEEEEEQEEEAGREETWTLEVIFDRGVLFLSGLTFCYENSVQNSLQNNQTIEETAWVGVSQK